MKIIAADGFALNPGDLDWAKIETLGDLRVFDRSSKEDIISRCSGADIVLTNKVVFNRETLKALPDLKLIAVLATGYNIIDIQAAKEQGITVCNVPDYGSASVAQHTFALILELANRVGIHSDSVHKGEWVKSKDFSYSLTPLIELQGKTLGIVGFGTIGRKTAVIARAFGMNVLYHTPSVKDTDLAEYRQLKELFSESDIVTLHLPLKDSNKKFVNRQLLSAMKDSAFLINTSRGPLIDEADLAEALNKGIIAGAAVDVLSEEPPPSSNPLLSARNCIITPHNAWMSAEARTRIIEITAENIRSFLKGSPVNVVS